MDPHNTRPFGTVGLRAGRAQRSHAHRFDPLAPNPAFRTDQLHSGEGTVVTCFFSVILARATLRYVEAIDKGLALAREEFEREWSPELHIKLERICPSEARIVVTHLGRTSVLLQIIQLRKLTHAVPSERWFLNDPLVGGMTWTNNISKRLLACTDADFEGQVAAATTFYASGRMFRTDWFRFHLQVRDRRLSRLDPSNILAPCARTRESQRPGASPRRCS
jgi:hypothetical protein